MTTKMKINNMKRDISVPANLTLSSISGQADLSDIKLPVRAFTPPGGLVYPSPTTPDSVFNNNVDQKSPNGTTPNHTTYTTTTRPRKLTKSETFDHGKFKDAHKRRYVKKSQSVPSFADTNGTEPAKKIKHSSETDSSKDSSRFVEDSGSPIRDYYEEGIHTKVMSRLSCVLKFLVFQ